MQGSEILFAYQISLFSALIPFIYLLKSLYSLLFEKQQMPAFLEFYLFFDFPSFPIFFSCIPVALMIGLIHREKNLILISSIPLLSIGIFNLFGTPYFISLNFPYIYMAYFMCVFYSCIKFTLNKQRRVE